MRERSLTLDRLVDAYRLCAANPLECVAKLESACRSSDEQIKMPAGRPRLS
jgi:hypothetical protein